MKISIITVCYNSEKTIERCINSVLGQSYSNIEYILIDGGSRDNTTKIIEKYKSKISYFVSEKDAGIYDAMNKGVLASTGEYLYFLNSDDWFLDSDSLQKMVTHIKQDDALYHAKIKYFHQDGRITLIGKPVTPADLKYELRGVHQPACLFPKNAFEKLGNFNTEYKIASDYDLIKRFSQVYKLVFIDALVVGMSDSGASSQQISRAILENLKISIRSQENRICAYWLALKTYFLLRLRYLAPGLYWMLRRFNENLKN